MVIIHSSFKDGRFCRLSFVAPVAAGAAAGASSLTPALISAGGSILAGGLGALAGGLSSSKYLKGVRETNETNLQLAREQRDWDLAQWNRENEYNSAPAQLARWQAAGFSPHSFVGVGSPGEAAALQSPSMANQVAPGDLSGFAGVTAQGIQQGVAGATKAALDWRQMSLNEKQLQLDKERLANETKETASKVSLNDALTKEALANVDFIKKRANFTESETYRSNALLEKIVQEWEQSAKLFPVLYGQHVVKLDQDKLNYLFSQKSFEYRLRQLALDNNMTYEQTRKIVAEGIYWLWQGKEGQFQYDTQDLRWTILSTQGKQLQFNLQFDKDTRYSQLTFERWMAGIDAAAKIGHLVIDGAAEIRQWIRPDQWLGNTSTWFDYNDKGRLEHVERSFTPFSKRW